jgi:hypothetical protein
MLVHRFSNCALLFVLALMTAGKEGVEAGGLVPSALVNGETVMVLNVAYD